MSLLDLPVTTAQELPKEYKPSVLGFAVKKSDYQNKKTALKQLYSNKDNLCIDKEFTQDDIEDIGVYWLIRTSKRFKDVVDSQALKTKIEDVFIIIDIYRWPKKTYGKQVIAPLV